MGQINIFSSVEKTWRDCGGYLTGGTYYEYVTGHRGGGVRVW